MLNRTACLIVTTLFLSPLLCNCADASELADAAEAKQWQAVVQLVRSGLDTNEKQPDGMTALHWAVYHNHPATVAKLLAEKANYRLRTEYHVSPASIACDYGYEDCLALLLNAGVDVKETHPGNESLLMKAARQGSEKNVKLLIDAGANVNKRESHGQTSLMWAAAEGNTEVVKLLLAAGADPKVELKSGFTAMFFAARNGRIGPVRLLHKAGVDINDTIDAPNSSGRRPRKRMSPLLFAVESGHFEMAIELVKMGADANDQRSGFSPLHALSWVRRPKWGDGVDGDPPPKGSGKMSSLEFVKEIVRLGADPNLKIKNGSGGRAKLNSKGCTPFLFASRTVDLPYMKLLLELGAKFDEPNVEGCTPFMAVAGVGVKSVNEEPGTADEVINALRFLAEMGADVNAVDANRETAMHGAAYRSYPKVALELATLGADPKKWNHKNKAGWTPYRIAEGYRLGSFKPSPEMQAALKKAMQNQSGLLP